MGLNKYALGHNKEANMQYYLYLPFYLNIKCILIMYFCASIVSAAFEKWACAREPRTTRQGHNHVLNIGGGPIYIYKYIYIYIYLYMGAALIDSSTHITRTHKLVNTNVTLRLLL